MAKTKATAGRNYKLQYRVVDSGGAYTTIAEVRKITPPEPEYEEADATHLDSPGDAEEIISTVMKTGEADVELNYTEDEAATLYAMLDGEDREWRILGKVPVGKTNGATLDWTGFLKKASAFGELEKKNVIIGKYKIRVSSGKPVFTKAS